MSLRFIDKNGQEVSIAGKGISGKDGEGIHVGSILGYNGSREDIPEGYEVVDSNIFVSTDSLPIGAGMDYFGTTAPANYMFADGSAISRTEYAELFAVIGTTYGAGDGETTFNLPDKRMRVSVMYSEGHSYYGTLGGQIGATSNSYTPGGTIGGTAITQEQLPKINLKVNYQVYPIVTNSDAIGTWTKDERAIGINVTDTTTKSSLATEQMGSGNTHTHGWTGTSQNISTVQPSLICNYIIKVSNE